MSSYWAQFFCHLQPCCLILHLPSTLVPGPLSSPRLPLFLTWPGYLFHMRSWALSEATHLLLPPCWLYSVQIRSSIIFLQALLTCLTMQAELSAVWNSLLFCLVFSMAILNSGSSISLCFPLQGLSTTVLASLTPASLCTRHWPVLPGPLKTTCPPQAWGRFRRD